MPSKSYTVSIGLPVRNGQRYVAQAIESILAQTFTDFELIISDNASTDDTEQVCRRYAAQDPRVRYYRQTHNIGAAANFNRTFELATGRYFKWAAHDDLIEPTYLEKCVEVLEADKGVILCQSLVWMGPDWGERVDTYSHAWWGTDRPRQSERFAARLGTSYCTDVLGVIRTDVLKTTPLIAEYIGSDRTLLVELALRGRFGLVPEHLFLNRTHHERLSHFMIYLTPAQQMAWWSPAKAGRRWTFEYWHLYLTCLRLVLRLVPDRMERVRCYGHMLRSLRVRGRTFPRWFRLVLELVIAVVPAAARIEGPLLRSPQFQILYKISRALGLRGLRAREDPGASVPGRGGPGASVADGLAE
jgi:glycosyltransferase involved in cell wall biosynthesis